MADNVAPQRDGAGSDEPAVHPAAGDRRAVGAVRQLGPPDAVRPVSDRASHRSRRAARSPAQRRRAGDAEERPAPRRRRESVGGRARAAVRRRRLSASTSSGARRRSSSTAARVHEIIRWLHDDPSQRYDYLVRRHRGRVPRSRAADRSRLASALAAVPPLPPRQGAAREGRSRSRCRACGTSTRAPIGWSASATTCSASRFVGHPGPAPHPDVGAVQGRLSAAEGLPAARPLQPLRAAAPGARRESRGALLAWKSSRSPRRSRICPPTCGAASAPARRTGE